MRCQRAAISAEKARRMQVRSASPASGRGDERKAGWRPFAFAPAALRSGRTDFFLRAHTRFLRGAALVPFRGTTRVPFRGATRVPFRGAALVANAGSLRCAR